MKNIIILLLTLLVSMQIAFAENYISPERYAVNEADFTDYRMIAPAKQPTLDSLEDDRFQAPNLIEKDFSIGETQTEQITDKKTKKQQKEELQPYQKRLSYKFAKWWVDQRYKREEAHHGALHEIKVEKRMLYEQQEQAKQAEKKNNNE